MEKIKWAVVSTGYIANLFTQGLLCVPDAQRCAVVSRNSETAQAFALKYDFQSSYTDYLEMLVKERPDVVYIAVPNDLHYRYVMQALEHGVHVLCEKPMPDNMTQLQSMLQKAKQENLFLMEGMWTRCFPAVRQARKWIANGELGRILTVRAFNDLNPDRAYWQLWKAGLEHSGGALRDVGIYSIAMASLAFSEYPQKVFSSFYSNGEVDEHCDLLLQYSDGGTGMLSGAFDRVSDREAVIIGEKGRITIGPVFCHPTQASLIRNDGSSLVFSQPFEATGFQYEIMRVQACLRQKLNECPDFSWQDSIQVCTLIDQLRREWNIVYRSDAEMD